MKWDDMTFTYHEKSTRRWIGHNYKHIQRKLSEADKNTADILVTNHSNADVKVGFVYKQLQIHTRQQRWMLRKVHAT